MEKSEVELLTKEESLKITVDDILNENNKVEFKEFKYKDKIKITYHKGYNMIFKLHKSYREHEDFKPFYKAIEQRLKLTLLKVE